MSDIRIIKTEEYRELIKSSTDKIIIIEFFATWCNPCKMVAPVLEELVNKSDKVEIYKMDVDENSELADDLNIHSIPTLLFYKDGEIKKQVIGFQPLASFEKIIETIE